MNVFRSLPLLFCSLLLMPNPSLPQATAQPQHSAPPQLGEVSFAYPLLDLPTF